MNRAFFIIFIPVLLVAAGYVAVFRLMGVAPGYPRLILLMALLFGAMYWLSRRNAGKPETNRQ
jgi:flagellar biosynthesis component FlhA